MYNIYFQSHQLNDQSTCSLSFGICTDLDLTAGCSVARKFLLLLQDFFNFKQNGAADPTNCLVNIFHLSAAVILWVGVFN